MLVPRCEAVGIEHAALEPPPRVVGAKVEAAFITEDELGGALAVLQDPTAEIDSCLFLLVGERLNRLWGPVHETQVPTNASYSRPRYGGPEVLRNEPTHLLIGDGGIQGPLRVNKGTYFGCGFRGSSGIFRWG